MECKKAACFQNFFRLQNSYEIMDYFSVIDPNCDAYAS